VFAVLPGQAAEDFKLTRKVERSERYLFGQIQSGPIAGRLNRVERELLGKESAETPSQKADHLFNFLFKGNEQSPSLDMKISFLEWSIFQETRGGRLTDRLAALDKTVTGKPSKEPLAFRVEQLIQMLIENGIVEMAKVTVPAGSELRVRLGKTVSSRDAKSGDEVDLTVLSDLIIRGNVLVVPKGGGAVGEVDRVRRAGRFGRPGALRFLVKEATAIDGVAMPARIKTSALTDDDKKKMGLAAGASAVGYLALGPVGLAGGLFIKGKDVTLAAGTELTISTLEDIRVVGIVVKRR